MTTTTHPTPMTESEKKLAPKTTNMLEDLRHDMEALWERPFQMLFEPFSRTFRNFKTVAAWTPTVDVFEKEGELIVKADLPGLTKENVKVTFEEGDLVLRGERMAEKEAHAESFYRSECSYGNFYRRLALPFAADPSLIAANFKNGVLDVKIPIPTGSRPESHPIAIH